MLPVEDPGPAKPDIHGFGEWGIVLEVHSQPQYTYSAAPPLKGVICLTLAVTTAIIEATNDVQGADALR